MNLIGLSLREMAVIAPASLFPAEGILTDSGDQELRAARRTPDDVLRRGLLAGTTPSDRQTLRRIW